MTTKNALHISKQMLVVGHWSNEYKEKLVMDCVLRGYGKFSIIVREMIQIGTGFLWDNREGIPNRAFRLRKASYDSGDYTNSESFWSTGKCFTNRDATVAKTQKWDQHGFVWGLWSVIFDWWKSIRQEMMSVKAGKSKGLVMEVFVWPL